MQIIMHIRVHEKIKRVMELGGKVRHVEVIPHTDVNDVSLKYF